MGYLVFPILPHTQNHNGIDVLIQITIGLVNFAYTKYSLSIKGGQYEQGY